MSKILSSEIVSLVHHVKLNESGWWEKAIQNIIISTFGINNNAPISEKEIYENLHNEIKTEIDIARLSKQFDVLKSKRIIISTADNLYLLSDETPKSGDIVLTDNYGVWEFKEIPTPMGYWGNLNNCKKIIKTTNVTINVSSFEENELETLKQQLC